MQLERFKVERADAVLLTALCLSLVIYVPILDIGFYNEYIYASDLALAMVNAFFLFTMRFTRVHELSRQWRLNTVLLMLALLVFFLGVLVSVFDRTGTRDLFAIETWLPPVFYFLRFSNWMVLLFFYLVRPISWQTARAVLIGLCLVSFLPVVSIYAEMAGLFDTPWEARQTRLIVEGYTGFISPHEGHASVILLSVLVSSLILFAKSRSMIAMIGAIMVFGAIVVTQRQSMIVALLAGFSLFILFTPMKLVAKGSLALIALLTGVGLAIFFSSFQGEELLSQYVTSGGQMSGNLAFRVIAPIAYIAYMIENNVSLVTGAGAMAATTNITLLGGAHNAYISVFFEFGLVGLLLLIACCARVALLALALADKRVRALLVFFLVTLGIYSLGGNVLSPNTHGANQFVLVATVFFLAFRVGSRRQGGG